MKKSNLFSLVTIATLGICVPNVTFADITGMQSSSFIYNDGEDEYRSLCGCKRYER